MAIRRHSHNSTSFRDLITPIEYMMDEYDLKCAFVGVMNADVMIGPELIGILNQMIEKQNRGELADRLLLVGRRVNDVGVPLSLKTLQEEEMMLSQVYQSNPFYSASRMVGLR